MADQAMPRPETGRSRFDPWAEATLALLIVAETALIWLVVAGVLGLAAEPKRPVPAVALFVVVGVASWLPRWLDAFDVWDPTYRVVAAGAVAASALLLVKHSSFPDEPWLATGWLGGAIDDLVFRPSDAQVPVWIVIVVVAAAWWRGRWRDEPGLDAAYLLLRVGTAVALAGAAVHAVAGRDDGDGAAAVTLFAVATLLAIGVARLAADSRRARIAAPRAILSAVAPAAIALALAVFVAGLVSRDLLDTLIWAVGPLLWALSVFLRVFVLAIAMIALILISPLLWLLSGRTIRLRPISISFGDPDQLADAQEMADRAGRIPDAIRYVVAALLLMLLFRGITAFVLRRRGRRPRVAPDEERSRIAPGFDLAGWLRALLGSLGGRGPATDDPLAELRGDPRWRHTVAIRETYARLLLWSRERGVPRTAAQTPVEHGRRLTGRLPGAGARADAATIAAHYERARYGAEPADAAAAEQVVAAWRRLERGGARGDGR